MTDLGNAEAVASDPSVASSHEGRAARRRAMGTVGKGLAMWAFGLGVLALALAGCAALLVIVLPETVKAIESAAQAEWERAIAAYPYSVSAALALCLGIPAVVCGAVAWFRARRASVNASVAIAGFVLGVVAFVFGVAMVVVEWLRWYGVV